MSKVGKRIIKGLNQAITMADLQAENEQLREALKPFASILNSQLALILFGKKPDDAVANVSTKLYNLRRAHSLIYGANNPFKQ